MITGVGLSVSLILFALNTNIHLYYTPGQLPRALPDHSLRLGGIVKNGSLRRIPRSLTIHFMITDFQKEIPIVYTGVVPSLFREGQGVVVAGQFLRNGSFQATQVLAKHDENYRPPGINA